MTDLFNEKGEAVQAFTPEEVEAKVAEEVEKAIEGVHTEHAEEQKALDEKLDQLEKEKSELEEKIKVAEEKGANFKTLREKADSKDKQIEALEKKIAETEASVNTKIEEIAKSNKQKELDIRFLQEAGGDKEMAEKIKVAYNKFAGIPTTEEEVQTRLQEAMVLATGGKPNILGSNIISASGGSKVQPKGASKFENSEVADMAKRNFGVSDQDLKKHKLI